MCNEDNDERRLYLRATRSSEDPKERCGSARVAFVMDEDNSSRQIRIAMIPFVEERYRTILKADVSSTRSESKSASVRQRYLSQQAMA